MPYNDHRDWRRLPRRQLGYKFGHFDGCPARAGRLDLARVSRLQMPSCRTRKHATRAGLTLTDRIQLCGSFRSLPTPALSVVPEIVFAPDGVQTLWRRTSRRVHEGPGARALRAMARGVVRGRSAVHGERVWPA